MSRHTNRPLPDRPAHVPQDPASEKTQSDLPVARQTMVELGSMITDTATLLKGMLTHYVVLMGGSRRYVFQPHGLNPETGGPVDHFFIEPVRIKGGKVVPEPDLPLDVLGTQAEDLASGFSGTAIELCLHLTGCVHITLQPRGKLQKTGESVSAHGFDIRRLKGPAIKPLTEPQRQVSQEKKPSPMGMPPRPVPEIWL